MGPKKSPKSQGSGGYNGDEAMDLAGQGQSMPSSFEKLGQDPNDGVGLDRRKGAED